MRHFIIITFSALSLLFVNASFAQRVMPLEEDSSGMIDCMLEYQGDLLIGGDFSLFMGQEVESFVIWDGLTSVTAPFESLPSTLLDVRDMVLFDGGVAISCNLSGSLYVYFWDGATLTQLGEMFENDVLALEVHNGLLYAGGGYEGIGTDDINYLAIWNGAQWEASALFDSRVFALESRGDDLIVGGDFETLNGAPTMHIASLSSGVWSQLGSGLDGRVSHIVSTPSGLWVEGDFDFEIGSVNELNGLAQFNSGQFQFLSDLPNSEGFVFVEGYGYCLSTEAGLFSDVMSNQPTRIVGARVNCSIQYNEVIYIGFGFNFGNPFPVGPIGRLIEGDFCSSFPFSSSQVPSCSEMDFGSVLYGDYLPGLPLSGAVQVPLPIYTMSPYVIANSGNDMYFSSAHIVSEGQFITGPVSDVYDLTYLEEYVRVWEIDSSLIANHIADWDTPDYTVPEAIATWPVSGDPALGQANSFFDYDDYNQNGEYDPENGDAPILLGNHAVASIRSDAENAEANAVRMNLLNTAHQYGDEDVVFLNQQYVNVSTHTYDTLYIGYYLDWDLGCFNNDYVGVDIVNRMSYVYNGSNDDLLCGGRGYGENPPAVGLVSLNSSLNSAYEVLLGGISGGTEPLALNNPTHIENTINGLNTIGDPILDPDGVPTSYSFTGDPNDLDTWSSLSVGNSPGDRRVLISIGPFFNIAPGDAVCLDLALLSARGEGLNNLQNVTLLKEKAAELISWYEAEGQVCGSNLPIGLEEEIIQIDFSMSPNPSSDRVRIASMTEAIIGVRVFDALGRLVIATEEQFAKKVMLDVSSLDKGLYSVQVRSAEGIGSRVLIKE